MSVHPSDIEGLRGIDTPAKLQTGPGIAYANPKTGPGLAKCGGLDEVYQITRFIKGVSDSSACVIRHPAEVYVQDLRTASAERKFTPTDLDKIVEIREKMGEAMVRDVVDTFKLVQDIVPFCMLCLLAEKLFKAHGKTAIGVLKMIAEDEPEIFSEPVDYIFCAISEAIEEID
jgi:hypothetical protein